MDNHTRIIALYSELAEQPQKDFGWDKGLENAKAHGYKESWFEKLPSQIWDYCAAVGNPFSIGDIPEGATVLDLGCGAGVDLLVAALLVGERGHVIGVDITPKIVEKAIYHAKEAGFSNVEVLESSFDNIALEDEFIDIVISNGAINLTSCKQSVFTEIYRVLKPNGKIYFADMIDISGDEGPCCSVEQSSCCESEDDWANCVAGTLRKEELIEIIEQTGFKNVSCTGLTHYTTADTTQGATFTATKIPAVELREKHWDSIFKSKDYTQVLWHQTSPQHSLDMIQQYAKKEDAFIDVGCGASLLVDGLLEDGYEDITLLDISSTCLNIVRERLTSSINPTYICSDILALKSTKLYEIWHDRAVFHFLLTKTERDAYFEVLSQSLAVGGIAIINTFATDGEIQCAGLDIISYDEKGMREILPDSLELLAYKEFVHTTPRVTSQKYSAFTIKKRLLPLKTI